MSLAASLQPSVPPPPPVPPVPPPPPVPPVPPPPVPPVPPVPPPPVPPWLGFEAPQPTTKHNRRSCRCRMGRTIANGAVVGIAKVSVGVCEECRTGSFLKELLKHRQRPRLAPVGAGAAVHSRAVLVAERGRARRRRRRHAEEAARLLPRRDRVAPGVCRQPGMPRRGERRWLVAAGRRDDLGPFDGGNDGSLGALLRRTEVDARQRPAHQARRR